MVLDGRRGRRERAHELLGLVGLAERLDTGRSACPAASSSASRSPSRWPMRRRSSSPTSRRASWTAATSHEVFDLLRRVNAELGTTIVIVTHDPVVSEQVQRTVAIRDGRTSTETLRRTELGDDGDHRAISRGVRGPRPGRPAPAAEAAHRCARAAAPGPAPPRGRPRRRLAGQEREVRQVSLARELPSDLPAAGPRWSRPSTSAATTPSATPSSTPCGGSTCRSGAASWSPSGADRGAARPRFSTCSAASTGRPPAASSSTATRSRPWSERELVGVRRRRSRSSSRRSGWSRSCPRPRTSRSRSASSMPNPRERDGRVADLLDLVGLDRPGAPPAARALGRGAAARRDRAGARQSAAASSSPTSRRASSTPTRATDHAAAPIDRPERGHHGDRGDARSDDARRRGPGRRAARRSDRHALIGPIGCLRQPGLLHIAGAPFPSRPPRRHRPRDRPGRRPRLVPGQPDVRAPGSNRRRPRRVCDRGAGRDVGTGSARCPRPSHGLPARDRPGRTKGGP